MPRYILVKETASTNTYLSRMAAILPGGTVIYTHRQTAGRGQKGNSWEAEPGKNLTFSMLVSRPAVPVRSQFLISEAVSIAIVEVVSRWADDVRVKWPNDIYCGDRKLCGILIENSLDAEGIVHSIIGVGLNVNQTTFVSDAPNPVSLAQVAGQELDLESLLHQVCERIEQLCDSLSDEAVRSALHERYSRVLYRNDGRPHTFSLPDGKPLQATIVRVDPDGMLTLRHADGLEHRYAFKEIKHVINDFTL